MRLASALALPLLAALPLAADPPDLVTDRPDQTESTATVPQGWVQTELGIGAADMSDEAATGLVRIGLSERVELRLGLDEADPSNDFSLGAKMRLAAEQGAQPAVSVIVAATRRGAGSKLRPSFRFAFANALNDRLTLAYNAGIAWDEAVGSGGLTSRLLWTASLGIAGTDDVGFFVEAFGDSALSASGAPENALDGGVTWKVRPNFQLDIFAGAGASDAAPDWFAGVGVSLRLPG